MADQDKDKDVTNDAPAKKRAAKKPAAKKSAGKKGATKKGAGRKGGASDGAVTVAGNAKAAAGVKRAKGWGGIGGFAIAAYLGYKANVPPDQLGLRALAAGAAGYLLAWACAVAVWRHILLAELRMRVEAKRPAPVRTITSGPEDAAASAAAAAQPPVGPQATPGLQAAE